jgi:hypothetical protein
VHPWAANEFEDAESDEGHDALMTLYHQRYTEQIEVADAATIMQRWGPYAEVLLPDFDKPFDRLFERALAVAVILPGLVLFQ